MIRTASLLVAFSLLTSAATAYAECVWVLWQRHIQPDGWMISRAFQTQRECESEVPNEELRIKNMREVMNKFTEQQSARGEKVTVSNIPLLSMCLPDTVDPRGPKGK